MLPSEKQIQICSFLKDHATIHASSYCIQCKKWLCNTCIDLHKNITYDYIHDLYDNDFIIENKCFKHNEEYSHFCSFCQRNLCEKCWMEVCPVNIGIHQEGFSYIERYIKKEMDDPERFAEKMWFILLDIKKDFENIRKQKDIIKETKKQYSDVIETNFEKSLKINETILNIAEVILLQIEISPHNYYPYLNFFQLCSWSIKNFAFDIKNINEQLCLGFINYLQNDFILDNKSKTKVNITQIHSYPFSNTITSFTTFNMNIYIGFSNGNIIYINRSLTHNNETLIGKHDKEITNLIHDTTHLISASKDNTIKIWESQPNNTEYILKHTFYSKCETGIQHLTLIGNNYSGFIAYSSYLENNIQVINIHDMTDIKTLNHIEQIHLINEEIITMIGFTNKYLAFAIQTTSLKPISFLKVWDVKREEQFQMKDIPCDGLNCIKDVDGFLVICGDLTITILKIENDIQVIYKTNFDNIMYCIPNEIDSYVFESIQMKYKIASFRKWNAIDEYEQQLSFYIPEYSHDYCLITNTRNKVILINLENKYDYEIYEVNELQSNKNIEWYIYEDNNEKGYYAVSEKAVCLFKVDVIKHIKK